jgi:hypothetical protein
VNENANLLDDERTACLCDVGRPEYVAATAIAADGTEHLVLAHSHSIGDDTVVYDSSCRDVAHEQLGPLPDRYRLGLQCIPIRCGRPTKTTGMPCRIEVAHPGQPCGLHRRHASS